VQTKSYADLSSDGGDDVDLVVLPSPLFSTPLLSNDDSARVRSAGITSAATRLPMNPGAVETTTQTVSNALVRTTTSVRRQKRDKKKGKVREKIVSF
jgi:hypothetical protein